MTEQTTPPDAKGSASTTRTDLEALAGSGRSKVILLATVLVVALAAAGWMFLRGGGTGNPEDPGRVLVVSRSPMFKGYLIDLGFEADLQTFDHLEEKARTELPGLDQRGVPAILALADRFGYGYVAFEGPQPLDFSELDVDGDPPAFTGDDQFAVISAGDLAFPHKVTGGSLLSALFEQDRLAEILPPKQPPTVEGVQLRDRLRVAIERLSGAPRLSPMHQRGW